MSKFYNPLFPDGKTSQTETPVLAAIPVNNTIDTKRMLSCVCGDVNEPDIPALVEPAKRIVIPVRK